MLDAECLLANLIVGTNGVDDLRPLATNGADLILALGKNDIIDGDAGADCILAGGGNDLIEVSFNEGEFDLVDGGAGFDTVRNVSGNNLFFDNFGANGQYENVEKLDANNKEVRGNGNANTFDFTGVQMVNVTKVKGEDDGDTIIASTQTHDITYEGNDGADTLTGQNKRDILLGGNGGDTIDAGGNNDTIDGGAGADGINAGGGNDLIKLTHNQGEFDDVDGGAGSDTVKNTGGNNLFFDNFGASGQYENVEKLDANNKEVRGNGNANTFDFTGVQMVNVTKVKGEDDGDTIIASTQTHDITYEGNDGADTLTGQNKRDILLGGNGGDTIDAGGNNDTIDGGAGADGINAGGGNDLIKLTHNQGEFDDVDGGAGSDTVKNTGGNNLFFDNFGANGQYENVEKLDANNKEVRGNGNANTFDFTGVQMVNVTKVKGEDDGDTIIASTQTHDITYEGNEGADTLTGQNKRDILLGGNGGDTIDGGGNNDTIDGGAGADDIDAGGGNDLIKLTHNQGEFDDVDGGAGSDTVKNTGGNNLFFNNFGASDQYENVEKLDANNKEVRGNGNANTFDFTGVQMVNVAKIDAGDGVDTIVASTQTHDVIYEGGNNADTLTGQNKRDILRGEDGADTLDGGGNEDTLEGGAGADDQTGGGGNGRVPLHQPVPHRQRRDLRLRRCGQRQNRRQRPGVRFVHRQRGLQRRCRGGPC